MHVDPTFSVGGLTYGLFGFYGDELKEFGFSEKEVTDLKERSGPFRTPNTIKYSNSFGPVSFEVDARFDETDKKGKREPGNVYKETSDGKGDEGGNGYAASASIAVNDNITLAAGVDNTKDGDSLTGGAIQVSLAVASAIPRLCSVRVNMIKVVWIASRVTIPAVLLWVSTITSVAV